jgi:hypothetical protein
MAAASGGATTEPDFRPPVTLPESTAALTVSARTPKQRDLEPEAPVRQFRPAPPKVVPLVTHNTRIPVHVKERLMALAAEVPGETQTTILVRALEREFDRMEKELNARYSRQE